MGKHETIKSTTRVQKHRAEMKAKGFRLRQFWSRDPNDQAFLAEIERANRAIAAHPEEEESVMDWIESMTTGVVQAEPDYKW
jgi:Protein  of unknown function (DUF3018)